MRQEEVKQIKLHWMSICARIWTEAYSRNYNCLSCRDQWLLTRWLKCMNTLAFVQELMVVIFTSDNSENSEMSEVLGYCGD